METGFFTYGKRERKERIHRLEIARGKVVAKRIKDKHAGESMEGVIQKVKYILEGRGRNEVLRGRGVQNTVIGLGVSQEIDTEPPRYPQGTRLGRAKISDIQRVPF
jgi:hypothetical protein